MKRRKKKVGNLENSDIILQEMENAINNRKDMDGSIPKGVDVRDALKEVTKALVKEKGYYLWTLISDPPVWAIRMPKNDEGSETWMKDERVELIHICSPLRIHDSMEREHKDSLAEFSGYGDEGKCTKCGREVPEDIEKIAQIQKKLYEVGQGVR